MRIPEKQHTKGWSVRGLAVLAHTLRHEMATPWQLASGCQSCREGPMLPNIKHIRDGCTRAEVTFIYSGDISRQSEISSVSVKDTLEILLLFIAIHWTNPSKCTVLWDSWDRAYTNHHCAEHLSGKKFLWNRTESHHTVLVVHQRCLSFLNGLRKGHLWTWTIKRILTLTGLPVTGITAWPQGPSSKPAEILEFLLS